MKIYLAGPDVFRRDVEAWVASTRELCNRYGFDPLFPIDNGETVPERFFRGNLDLIRKAQIVAANLDPFRGPEPDSGTAFELGYALALNKKICGYVTRQETLVRRVEVAEGRRIAPAPGGLVDRAGMLIEDFWPLVQPNAFGSGTYCLRWPRGVLASASRADGSAGRQGDRTWKNLTGRRICSESASGGQEAGETPDFGPAKGAPQTVSERRVATSPSSLDPLMVFPTGLLRAFVRGIWGAVERSCCWRSAQRQPQTFVYGLPAKHGRFMHCPKCGNTENRKIAPDYGKEPI